MASPTDDSDAAAALAYLRSPRAVRERCRMVLAAGEAGALRHFVVRMERLDHAADRVLDEIRLGYPDLVIPYHSRRRHLVVNGVHRWAAHAAPLSVDTLEGGPLRAASPDVAGHPFDLAVASVLLIKCAGRPWTARDTIGKGASRERVGTI